MPKNEGITLKCEVTYPLATMERPRQDALVGHKRQAQVSSQVLEEELQCEETGHHQDQELPGCAARTKEKRKGSNLIDRILKMNRQGTREVLRELRDVMANQTDLDMQ